MEKRPTLLPLNTLEKRALLTEKPAPVVLSGKYVRLEPLIISRDAKRLFQISNGSPISSADRSFESYDADALVWRYMFDGPFNSIVEFENSFSAYLNATNGLCLCVFDDATRQQVGVANFMNNMPAHLKIELGGIWYSPIAQGTKANTEATYLMLKHVFELQ